MINDEFKDETPRKRSYHSPRRQEQASHTRERIFKAALHQLKDKGYANMSLDSIAREAGVAPQTVYSVCGSKKGALARILDGIMAENKYDKIRDAVLQMRDKNERVAAMAHFHTMMQHSTAPGFELLRGVGVIDPELSELEKDKDTMLYERCFAAMKQMADLGMLKKNLTAEEATDLLWGYAASGIYRRLVVGRGWSLERYTAQAEKVFRFLLLDEDDAEKPAAEKAVAEVFSGVKKA